MAQDYYKLLEVGKTASQDEIQKSYRKLAHKYHPDMNPDDKSAKQKFKDIQHAYDVLSEPEKRQLYDQYGPDFDKMGPGGGGSPFAGRGGFEDIFGGAGPGGYQMEGDLGDILRQFGGAAAAGRGRGRTTAARKGRDLSSEITVPFSTAVLGGQASIAITREGKPESLQVKIPPGIESGKKMRLRGQGEPSLGGGTAGDLLLTVHVASHPFFKRSGKNLELRLPITLGEAALGATVDVPTPNGTVALKIPPGSNSGRRLRIQGQGVLSPNESPGDLFVELQIKLPESFSDAEAPSAQIRQAVESIENLYRQPPRSNIIW